MTVLTIGDSIKDFTRPATNQQNISLNQLKGKNVVLYFYPKDNTPGCTQEGHDFTHLLTEFKKLNTIILGVSRDSIRKHENFKAKYKFTFDLISDEDESLCKQFDVIKLKKLYGKEYLGIERSTFLIDTKSKLVQEWRKVKVKDHAEKVLEAVKAL